MTTSWPGCSQSRAPVKCDSPDAGHDNPCCRTRGRRPKASREETRGEEFCGGALYGDFGIADGSAARRREGPEQGSTALVSVRDRLWLAPAASGSGDPGSVAACAVRFERASPSPVENTW